MQAKHGDAVRFFVVYIREAHALGSPWPMGTCDGAVMFEARDLAERRDHAHHCMSALSLAPIPAVVDDLDDAANRAYEAWPDRLILIDREGRVAFRSGPGPFGFDVDALEKAIVEELGIGAPARDAHDVQELTTPKTPPGA